MNRFALLAILAFLATGVFAQQVYKWTDDKGRVHYGERPPEGVKSTPVGVSSPTGNTTAPPVSQDYREKEAEYKRQRMDREKKEAQGEREAAVREQRCASARRQLAALQEQIRIYDRNEKGERVYLEDADRPAAIAGAQRRVDENCR